MSGDGHPFWYFSKAELEEYDVEDVKRLVREYEPPGEQVLMLLKSETAPTATACARNRAATRRQARLDLAYW